MRGERLMDLRLPHDDPPPRRRGVYVVEAFPRGAVTIPVIPSVLTIPVAQRIPAADWRSGMLVVRVHAVVTFVAASPLFVNVRNVAPSVDDPGADFVATSTIASLALGGTAPKLWVAALTAPIGPMLQVDVGLAPFPASGQHELTLSIELIGRTA